MFVQTKWFIFLMAFGFSLFFNFWSYCIDQDKSRPLWSVGVDIILSTIIIGAIIFTIYYVFNINVFAGNCWNCGNHYVHFRSRWSPAIETVQCQYCGKLLWYIQNFPLTD